MNPEHYERSNAEATSRLLGAIRNEIEETNRQVNQLCIEVERCLPDIEKSIQKISDDQTVENTLYSIGGEVSKLSSLIADLGEICQTLVREMNSQTRLLEKQPPQRNYHPWFFLIAALITISFLL